ncbi:MAG: hypothetical protein ACLVKO_09100 [Dysgonomonas sp.]
MNSTKQLFRYILPILIAPLLFVGCGDDDDDDGNTTVTEIRLSEETIWFTGLGKNLQVEILSGNGGYKTRIDNPKIAQATIKNNVVTVKPLSGGLATLTITDKRGKLAELDIIVDDSPSVNPSYWAYFNAGDVWEEPVRFEWYDRIRYVNSDKKVVSVTFNKETGKMEVKGLSVGETTVTLFDNEGKSYAYGITIFPADKVITAADFMTDNTLWVRYPSSETCQIYGIPSTYEVTSANPEMVQAEMYTDNSFIFRGLRRGQTTVTIRDTKHNRQSVINISVI